MTEVYRAPVSHDIEPESTEHWADDLLIVPGTRIGPVTLGLSMDQVIDHLGKGTLRPHEHGMMHLYESLGLVIYAENDKVTSVTVRSPEFATRQGLRVGDDVDRLVSTLGKDYELVGNEKSYVLHNWSQGWHAGAEDNRITYIQVTPTLMDEGPAQGTE